MKEAIRKLMLDSSIEEGVEIGKLTLQKLLFNIEPDIDLDVWNMDDNIWCEGSSNYILSRYEEWNELEVCKITVNKNKLEIHASKDFRVE